jgi:fumarate reductase subunit C
LCRAGWISGFECILNMLLSMYFIHLSASANPLMFFICIISCCALVLVFVTFFQSARIVMLLCCFSHVTWKSR